MSTAAPLGAEVTLNVPLLVNVWMLYPPTVVIVPPVATIAGGLGFFSWAAASAVVPLTGGAIVITGGVI
jgi:hypothetical protein